MDYFMISYWICIVGKEQGSSVAVMQVEGDIPFKNRCDY